MIEGKRFASIGTLNRKTSPDLAVITSGAIGVVKVELLLMGVGGSCAELGRFSDREATPTNTASEQRKTNVP